MKESKRQLPNRTEPSKLERSRERLGLNGPSDPKTRHEIIRKMSKTYQERKLSKDEANAIGRRFAPNWLRLVVLERDKYRCRYCHKVVTVKTANIDHVKPWPYGMTEINNLVTACRDCNRNKGRSENYKWRRKLRTK